MKVAELVLLAQAPQGNQENLGPNFWIVLILGLAGIAALFLLIAAIAFAAGMRTPLDQVVLVYFAVCGLSRLARYNITAEKMATSSGAVRYFEGTPIPTSIIPLGVLMAAFAGGNLYPVTLVRVTFHAVVVLFLLSGSLMISKTIRIPKP